jgi:hypothetical protein
LLCLAIIGNTTILIVILVTGTRRRSHGWKATSETLWWSMKIGQFVIIISYHSFTRSCLIWLVAHALRSRLCFAPLSISFSCS